MAKRAEVHGASKLSVIEMRQALAHIISANAQSPSEHATAIPGLLLFRPHRPQPLLSGHVRTKPDNVRAGRKLINLGGMEYLCDGSSFLVSSIDVPVQSQIVEASEQVPLLSMLLRLNMLMVQEVLSREDLLEAEGSSQPQGLAVGETTVGLLGACARLIELLDTPEDIPFVSPLIQREIVYRILRLHRATTPCDRHTRRPEQQNCESDRLAQGQLH